MNVKYLSRGLGGSGRWWINFLRLGLIATVFAAAGCQSTYLAERDQGRRLITERPANYDSAREVLTKIIDAKATKEARDDRDRLLEQAEKNQRLVWDKIDSYDLEVRQAISKSKSIPEWDNLRQRVESLRGEDQSGSTQTRVDAVVRRVDVLRSQAYEAYKTSLAQATQSVGNLAGALAAYHDAERIYPTGPDLPSAWNGIFRGEAAVVGRLMSDGSWHEAIRRMRGMKEANPPSLAEYDVILARYHKYLQTDLPAAVRSSIEGKKYYDAYLMLDEVRVDLSPSSPAALAEGALREKAGKYYTDLQDKAVEASQHGRAYVQARKLYLIMGGESAAPEVRARMKKAQDAIDEALVIRVGVLEFTSKNIDADSKEAGPNFQNAFITDLENVSRDTAPEIRPILLSQSKVSDLKPEEDIRDKQLNYLAWGRVNDNLVKEETNASKQTVEIPRERKVENPEYRALINRYGSEQAATRENVKIPPETITETYKDMLTVDQVDHRMIGTHVVEVTLTPTGIYDKDKVLIRERFEATKTVSDYTRQGVMGADGKPVIEAKTTINLPNHDDIEKELCNANARKFAVAVTKLFENREGQLYGQAGFFHDRLDIESALLQQAMCHRYCENHKRTTTPDGTYTKAWNDSAALSEQYPEIVRDK